jgi:hypothetical protein
MRDVPGREYFEADVETGTLVAPPHSPYLVERGDFGDPLGKCLLLGDWARSRARLSRAVRPPRRVKA